jgi:hypothetical protein
MTRIQLLPGRWIIWAIVAGFLLDSVLLLVTDLRIDRNLALAGYALWGVVGGAIWYRLRKPATRVQQIIRDVTEGASLFALISLLGVVASYPLAAGHHALIDTDLERVDTLLHFNWMTWYLTVADHPMLQFIGRTAYRTIFTTPALLVAYFAWTDQRSELRLFMATFAVAEFITLILFPLFPATGPFVTPWHGAVPYMPLSGFYQDQVTLALRHHQIAAIDLGALHGVVCAPSFHAASAVIYMAIAWRVPPLRWPVIALNVVMLLATPVEGTHYLADILIGMMVALVAVWMTPALLKLATRPAFGSTLSYRQARSVAAE